MDNGYIKIYRKMIDNGWFKNPKLVAFWIYLLSCATWKDKSDFFGYHQVQLKPGQFLFSRRKAAEETGLTEQEIRTCLTFLKKAKNLTHQTTHHYSVISIDKWENYQNENNPHSTHTQPTLNPHSTHPNTLYKKGRREEGKKTLSLEREVLKKCGYPEDWENWFTPDELASGAAYPI